jgi:hypothetical protein
MIDIESFVTMLQVKWVKSLLSNEFANWKVIPSYFLNKFGKNFLVFYMNLKSVSSLPKDYYTLPDFYKELIKKWILFKNINKKQPKHFFDIRKEIIWGNEHILWNKKSLYFHNWINSDIIFVNDIIDTNGDISEHLILSKLRNKSNWLSEIYTLRKALPQLWKFILKSDESIKTRVKTDFSPLLTKESNKEIYNILRNNKAEKPYIHRLWEILFEHEIPWNKVYLNIKSSIDNRYKQFRYKLIHNIIPTGDNLYKWKLKNSPKCVLCNCTDSTEHFFIHCQSLNAFWKRIIETFKSLGICKHIFNLKNIVLGYSFENTQHSNLWQINLIFTIIGFSIYKAYMMSNQRADTININGIFLHELNNMKLYLVHKKYNSHFIKRFTTNF